jgi:hypothetical protein
VWDRSTVRSAGSIYPQRYNPAKAWAEDNRDRLAQWLAGLSDRARTSQLQINPWLPS